MIIVIIRIMKIIVIIITIIIVIVIFLLYFIVDAITSMGLRVSSMLHAIAWRSDHEACNAHVLQNSPSQKDSEAIEPGHIRGLCYTFPYFSNYTIPYCTIRD